MNSVKGQIGGLLRAIFEMVPSARNSECSRFDGGSHCLLFKYSMAAKAHGLACSTHESVFVTSQVVSNRRYCYQLCDCW